MARGGGSSKMTKLKSVIKKWQSMSSKIGSSASGRSSIAATNSLPSDFDASCYNISSDLHPVYVGKSRRRYLITSDIIDHPLVKELVDRSDGSDTITVGCEVVLFEHLLWMLQNADPQPESLEELVEFYAS